MSGCAAPCEDAGNQVKQGYEAQAGSRTLPPNGGTCEVRLVRFRARHTSTHQVRAHTSAMPWRTADYGTDPVVADVPRVKPGLDCLRLRGAQVGRRSCCRMTNRLLGRERQMTEYWASDWPRSSSPAR